MNSSKFSFLAGVLPLIGYMLVENYYGPFWGVIAGIAIGASEIIIEKIQTKKISKITWMSNLLVFILGAVSLISDDGIWFKLQPAILEFAMFAFFLWSWYQKQPFLWELLKKQNPTFPDHLKEFFSGITFRSSFFMLFHSLLATWAAFFWTTEAWVALKGLGFTISFVVYLFIEMFFIRHQIKKGASPKLTP